MQSADEIIHTRRFIEFVEEVRRFCDFIEQNSVLDTRSFLQQLQSHLQELYLFGHELPLVDLYFNEEFGDPLPKAALQEISGSIAKRLGDNNYYWYVFDPADENNTAPVCGDLSEDILSVYQDLKNPLLLFDTQAPAAMESALWSFRSNFTIHWGDHCVNAIYALHYFIQRTV
jgi:hypothetical protein